MSRPVYSKRLLQGSTFSGTNQQFVAPAGYTTVVRELTAAQPVAGTDDPVEWILTTPTGAGIVIAYQTLRAQFTSDLVTLRLIMNEGETLTASNLGPDRVDVTASGYWLTLP